MAADLGADASCFDFRSFELPLYDEDLVEVDGVPETVLELKSAVRKADCIVFGCPEYNASITPLMKNAIDWVSVSPEPGMQNEWSGKVCALLSSSPGKLGGIRGLSHLRDILTNVGALVIAEQTGVGRASKAYLDGSGAPDARTEEIMQSMIESLVQKAARLK
jgi:NAD(P)H-dependent FMN reductase